MILSDTNYTIDVQNLRDMSINFFFQTLENVSLKFHKHDFGLIRCRETSSIEPLDTHSMLARKIAACTRSILENLNT